MGDEKRGDELFEDLDKFFAPIRDVDWDEPEEQTSKAPEEEHVEVKAPAYREPEAPEEEFKESEEDESWYDSGALEPIDELLGEGPEVLPEDDVVVVSRPAEHSNDQEDLFGEPGAEGASEAAELQDDDWPTSEEPEPTIMIEADEMAEAGETTEAPSDEDLEAAAAHFAGSIDDEEGYDTEPSDIYGTEGGGDLLSDLGAAEDVEEDILSDLDGAAEPRRPVTVGTEGITGPSWQEPAAVEIGASVERGTGERDVPAAFMTGLVLAGVALAALWIGPAPFAVVATIAVLVAQGEFFGVMVKHHAQPATAVGLVAGALMMAGAYFRGEAAPPAMFALGVMAAFVWYMTVPATYRKDILKNVGLTVLNMAWIPLLAGYLIATLKLTEGRALVVAVVGLTFFFDTAAFLVGSIWGGSFFQRPLASHISPKKSLEGLLGATVGTVVVAGALVPSFIDIFHNRQGDAVLLGLVVSVVATLGDLAESLVKRDLGIKDMGSVLPGHGGVLDRIDSLLFVAPAAFLLFRVVLV